MLFLVKSTFLNNIARNEKKQTLSTNKRYNHDRYDSIITKIIYYI